VSYSTRCAQHRKCHARAHAERFPSSPTKIEHAWGGYVDITLNRAPDFNRLAPNVYYLQGFSGHGIALTGMAGRLVAEAIAGQAERFDLVLETPAPRLPRRPGAARAGAGAGDAVVPARDLPAHTMSADQSRPYSRNLVRFQPGDS
jgi:glycine/D-amino acid oxidase-like deaminating enzyme